MRIRQGERVEEREPRPEIRKRVGCQTYNITAAASAFASLLKQGLEDRMKHRLQNP